jgi:cytochrome c553
MRRTTAFVALICIGAVPLAACEDKKKADPSPTATTSASAPASASASAAAKPADPAVLKRGDYLVNVVMACASCHTAIGPTGPELTKKFAGGLEVPDMFGTWRSSNITQDKKTGIGGWTDEQIITAIREGKRPTGDQMFPIMPYPFFHSLSDDDAKAIVAYLRTIAPIENVVAGNTDLKLPKVPMPKPKGTAPGKSPAEQGNYLGTLMHCAQCHTPLDPKTMEPVKDKFMAGGFKFTLPFLGTGDLYSANLTPDKATGIGNYSDTELGDALTKLKKKDGKPIQGPMTITGMNWSKLEPDDVKAINTWMRELKPVDNKVPKSTFKPNPAPAGSGSAAASGSASAKSGATPAGSGSAPKK